jgi:hypothetical protein
MGSILFDVSGTAVQFDGGRLVHANTPHRSGDRYAIVAFHPDCSYHDRTGVTHPHARTEVLRHAPIAMPMVVGRARSVEALAASAQLLVALAASRFHRKGPGVAPAKYARDAHTLLFGRTRSRLPKSRGGEDKSRVCKDNTCFPAIYALAVDYLTLLLGYHPLDRFMSLFIAKNSQCVPHYDMSNVGPSVLTAIGDYTDGGLLEISTRPTLHPCRACKRGNHAREECRNRRRHEQPEWWVD